MQNTSSPHPLTVREVRRSLRTGRAVAIRTQADEAVYRSALEAENRAAAATRTGLGRVPVFAARRDEPTEQPSAHGPRTTRKGIIAGKVRVWFEELPYRCNRDYQSDAEADAAIAAFKAQGLEAVR
jgi:hypothetical protein